MNYDNSKTLPVYNSPCDLLLTLVRDWPAFGWELKTIGDCIGFANGP